MVSGLGSAKFSNEGAYLFRKFAAFWGTNSVDHQARICHSTTVAGVANTWGYGAQTNSYNDIRNSKTIIFMGGNAAEAHPVSLQHILDGKEINRANLFVIDPRMTRTAAHATEYVRIRNGTDIPIIWGCSGTSSRTAGKTSNSSSSASTVWMTSARKQRSGVRKKSSASPAFRARSLKGRGRRSPQQKPSTLIWCMGATQHTVGTANVRAFCISAAGDRQCRLVRHRRQYLPWTLQRAGRNGSWRRRGHAAALLWPDRAGVAALEPRLGSRLRLAEVAFRRSPKKLDDERARHSVDTLA